MPKIGIGIGIANIPIWMQKPGTPPALTAPVNNALPVLSGNTITGSVLTCTDGSWSGNPAPTYTYAWWIAGALDGTAGTANTFTIRAGDVGKTIQCRVTATNSQGNATANSNIITATTTLAPPVNTVAPVASGTATVGSVVSCSPGTWTGSPAPAISQAWFADGVAIPGAVINAYTITTNEIGKILTCKVTGTNSSGSDTVDSNALGPVPATAPVNTVAPQLTGSALTENTLSVSNGTWTGDPAPTFTYGWTRDDIQIAGANANTYRLVAADIGAIIQGHVRGTNTYGNSLGSSNTVGPVVSTPAVNTVAPAISGNATVGSTLTTTNGTWTGNPAPTFTYQWYADDVLMAGKTQNILDLLATEIGKTIHCAVRGSNTYGNATAQSNDLGPVSDVSGGAYVQNRVFFEGTANLKKNTYNDVYNDAKGTLFVTADLTNMPNGVGIWFFDGSNRVRAQIYQFSNKFRLHVNDDAGARLGEIETVNVFPKELCHIIYTWDMSVPTMEIWVNGVNQAVNVIAALVTGVVGWREQWNDYGIWGNANVSEGDLWASPGAYMDLSVPANMDKIFKDGITPVYLGEDGALPFGFKPVFFWGDTMKAADWQSGAALGISTPWTVTGTWADAAPDAPAWEPFPGALAHFDFINEKYFWGNGVHPESDFDSFNPALLTADGLTGDGVSANVQVNVAISKLSLTAPFTIGAQYKCAALGQVGVIAGVGVLAAPTNQIYLSVNAGNSTITLVQDTTAVQATLSDSTFSPIVAGTTRGHAASIELNNIKQAINGGGNAAADTVANLPDITNAVLQFLERVNNTSPFNGSVANVVIMAGAMSQAALNTFSTNMRDYTGSAGLIIPPSNSTPPVITGNPVEGSSLSVSTGVWAGTPTPALSRQWKADGSVIPGETSDSLTLTAVEVGAMITCTVTGENTGGSASVTSASTGPVAEAPAGGGSNYMENPSLYGYADATNTGCRIPDNELVRIPEDATSGPGWAWNTQYGYVRITTADTVFAGFIINGGCDIEADGIIVRDCHLRCRAEPDNDGWLIGVRYAQNYVIEHVTLEGFDALQNRIRYAIKTIYGNEDGVIRYNDIKFASCGVSIDKGHVFMNYIHDMGFSTIDGGDHCNCIMTNGGMGPLTIEKNTCNSQLNQTSAIALYTDVAALGNRAVIDNLLSGGSYCTYGGASGDQSGTNPPPTNIDYSGNRFSRMFYPNGGAQGPVAYFTSADPLNSWVNNVWDDTNIEIATPG